ncbi:hypothetical protein LOZ53_002575 [Ophidiomyces ophidiicola]|uniref:Uncharacterized protein n=1 Tax=Ophidiomyces ophidiicola TaxID=1387563 RepID=A0ACB8UQZ7_9EURO|nr:uncharacterized protein LOZ57_000452 [Ophidiomyces ophidiicola]KAI1909374.1 hypothetical protein LOZ61_005009 [Ophidiomyces ophidiicola]KAI1916546.1 hypothetical protein LOZ64_003295 [Ophidiomyces ophidiicola]KAI1927175.1 hypothetical protein LOZ60_003227 [Ophidiomyces ophidiicola]KAI1954105.1 hypothetical protein LOZ57_000452 [Ophidiomyces ophidiicola]KAI1981680.1 hypothetical protein LOZ55_000702 [Ophidiomyces ophidiicola]
MVPRNHFTRIPSASGTVPSATANSYGGSQNPTPAPPPSSVRRNLFHSHFSRRQQPSSTSSSSLSSNRTHTRTLTGGDGSGLSSDINGSSKYRLPAGALSLGAAGNSISDGDDLVVRDKNGSYKIDMPMLQPGALGEMASGENGNAMATIGGDEHMGLGPDGGMTSVDKEKIDAGIAEMMRRNRSRQLNSEPSEVYLLIQQSLQNRVALLEEDRWMFESEQEIRT